MLFWKKKPNNTIKRGNWLKIEHSDNGAFAQLSGNLNRTIDKKLRESLEILVKQYDGNKIIIDLSQIYFIDATIAATLAETARQAKKRKVRLLMVDASSPVEKVFANLGIEHLLSEA